MDSLYEYNEENYDILQKTITIEPECGQLIYLGGGEYLFTAPDTLTVDSVAITINYENYNQFCARWDAGEEERIIVKDNFDCIDCPLPFLSILSRDYASGQLTIAWDSLDVKVVPDTIYPGDTAQVVIKKRLPDGTLTDFPPEQTFEIAKLEGCMSGNILAAQDSGAYFYDVSQPIYFAAADSLVGDSTGIVLLQVGLVTNYKKSSSENKPNNIESNECFTGNFQSESNEKKTVMINEVCTIGWDPVIHHIDSEPQMPSLLTIWLQPNNYVGEYQIDWDLEVKWVSKEQEPDKVFAYTFHNTKTANTPDGTDLPLPENDETIVGGDEITLTGRYYDSNYPNGFPFNKKLTGMKILGTNGENNVQIVNDYINTHEFPEIDLPLSEAVSTEDQRKQMQKIVQLESTYFQFKDERDEYHNYPPDEWGYPNAQRNSGKAADWGLCQLNDWEPSLGVIWNWKTNINAGIHFLWTEKYEQLKRDGWGGGFYEIKEKLLKEGIEVRNLNRQEFLLWLTQRYHGGQYYNGYTPGNKKGEKGTWVVNSDHHDYGHNFCILFGGWECDDLK